MKYLTIFLLLFSTNHAWSQPLEIGVRGGLCDNINFCSAASESNYINVRSGIYIHIPSKKRLSYELSINHFRHENSISSSRPQFGVYPIFSNSITQNITRDNYYDLSVTAFHNLHKNVPFLNRKLNQYIGFSAGVLFNDGRKYVKQSFADTNVVYNNTYSSGKAASIIFGIHYLMTYEILNHLHISCLVSFKVSDGILNSVREEYPLDDKPNGFLSFQIGFGYKF